MNNLHTSIKYFNVKKVKVSEKERDGTRWMTIEIISENGDKGNIVFFYNKTPIEIEGLKRVNDEQAKS